MAMVCLLVYTSSGRTHVNPILPKSGNKRTVHPNYHWSAAQASGPPLKKFRESTNLPLQSI